MNQSQYIRPLFTCGAFNAKAQTALMYNTARGECYSFEGVSALLVRELLATPREGAIDIPHVASVTGTTIDDIETFLHDSFLPIGLVCDQVLSDEAWQQYRKATPPSIAAVGYEPEDDYEKSLPELLRVKLAFELTYACSERCLHCFNEGAARSDLHEEHRIMPGMLRLEDYKRLIDEVVELGIPQVTVTGGDPFSHPECWAILDYLHEKNLAVNLLTNALALDSSEKIRRIARLGLRQFSVSVYSADAAVHDQITRRPGSWQRSMQALEELARWPVPLNIKTPVFRLNTRTYYGVRRMAQALSAENEITCGLMPGVDGDISIIEHLQPRPDALRIILMDPGQRVAVPADGQPDGYEVGQERGFPCSANAQITVTPTGGVKSCGHINVVYGRVPQSPLRALICSEHRQRLIHSDRQRLIPGCGAHDYCRYCKPPCFAGKKYEQHADGSIAFEAMTADDCLMAKARMAVCQQLQQGHHPLGGQSVETCLNALPVEEVPVFCKKIVR